MHCAAEVSLIFDGSLLCQDHPPTIDGLFHLADLWTKSDTATVGKDGKQVQAGWANFRAHKSLELLREISSPL